MEKLKNGATIISKSKCDGPGYVILAKKERIAGYIEYITWITDNDMNCFWGHYTTDLKEARTDYKDRVKHYC